jgi:hypothetical protein
MTNTNSKPGLFRLLSGDASGIPALYARRHGCGIPGMYDVYEINLWEDLDSSAIATHGKYNVQAGTVDTTDLERAADALRWCGWAFEFGSDNRIIVNHDGEIVASLLESDIESFERVIVEAMWGYGAKEVTADVSGNNLRTLVREARNSL